MRKRRRQPDRLDALRARLDSLVASLHPGQRQIYLDPARIRILNCGARWGKDRLGLIDLITKSMMISSEPHRIGLIPGVLSWYVAPTYGLLRQAWAEAERFLYDLPGVVFKITERQIVLPGRVVIEFKSADRPGALLGRGLDFVVVTEAARLKPEAFYNSLLSRLNSPGRGPSGAGGRIMANSTPAGRGWWFDICTAAAADAAADMRYYHYTTYDNPYVNPAEIDRQRFFMTATAFRQEYLAEFVEPEAGVFRGVADCLAEYPYPAPAASGRRYSAGIDWGRHGDASAVVVLDVTDSPATVAAVLHLKNRSYSDQIVRIAGLLKAYSRQGTITAESNSLGDPLIESLRNSLPAVRPFFTNASRKMQIIEAAALAIEQREILFPAKKIGGVFTSIEKTLTDELSYFSAKTTAAGSTIYSAPDGLHDDLVMAFCLAFSGRATGHSIMQPVYK